MTVLPHDIAVVENAAALIEEEAAALQACHTPHDAPDNWSGEERAKESYDRMRKSVEDLRLVAKRMEGQ